MDWSLLARALLAIALACVGLYGLALCVDPDDERDLADVDVVGDDAHRRGVAG